MNLLVIEISDNIVRDVSSFSSLTEAVKFAQEVADLNNYQKNKEGLLLWWNGYHTNSSSICVFDADMQEVLGEDSTEKESAPESTELEALRKEVSALSNTLALHMNHTTQALESCLEVVKEQGAKIRTLEIQTTRFTNHLICR